MQIFLQSLGGTATYNVTPDMTVEALKARVENEEFIPMTLQRLCVGTTQLMTGTLAENGVEEADTIKLLMNVNGGMRAKWRKKRMRRLRRKRRKMRQRAR